MVEEYTAWKKDGTGVGGEDGGRGFEEEEWAGGAGVAELGDVGGVVSGMVCQGWDFVRMG